MELVPRGVVALALAVGPAGTVAAQSDECDSSRAPGPVETTPASGARGIPVNSPIRVDYTDDFFAQFPDLNPETSIELRRCTNDDPASPDCMGESVEGTVEVLRDETLLFVPRGGRLMPNTAYEGTAFGTDTELPFNFETGSAVDRTSPDFGEIESFNSSKVDMRPCEAPEGGYRIDVQFSPASDVQPATSIEYLLYQTRGVNVDGPTLRARARGFTTSGSITMAFVLEPEAATKPICVTVHAVDAVGQVDDDADPVCFDPIQGDFFQPLCSVSRVAPPASAPGLPIHAGWLGSALLAGAVLGVLCRRRRRSTW